jgi:hypothetical protein
MALPRKVQARIDEANRLYEAAYKKEEEPKVKPVADEPAKEPLSTAEGEPQNPPVENENPQKDGGAQSEPAQTAQEDAVTGDEVDESQKWEHKYNVLNGKYKAEVPRLHRTVKELQEQISQLQTVIAGMNTTKAAPSADQPVPSTSSVRRMLKDQEIEEYGEDLIDVIKRAAMEAAMPEIDRLKAENAELQSKLGSVTETFTTNARQKVYDRLDNDIPNWRDINSDEGYLAWLDTLDAYTNRMRRELLNEAFESNDAARVVAFFKGYLNENATVSRAYAEAPTPEKKPKVDMSTLAAPGKSKGGTTPSTQEPTVWRQSEIAAFYADVRRGKFKNDPQAKERYEASIMDAIKHKRVTT